MSALRDLDLAAEATRVLRRDERTQAVLLFGSAAREEATASSDLDLMVLHRGAVPEQALDQIDERVSISFFGAKRFAALPERSPLFALHLAREGRVLWDPDSRFERVLNGVGPLDRLHEQRLKAITAWRLDAVRDDPHFAPADELSAGQLYALAKQVAMLASARRGSFQFNRHHALAELGSGDPRLSDDHKRVELLEDAWLARRASDDWAWKPDEAVAASAAEAAIRMIGRVVDDRA